MIAFLTTVIAICVVVVLYSVFMLQRNDAVLRERLRIIDEIGRMNKADILAGKGCDGWRWDAFNEIAYEAMLYKFWIPVANFYRDHRCLT